MTHSGGTVDAEIKVPSVENPQLMNVLPLKPGVSQNIAMYALLTARNFFHVLISTYQVHSPSFFSKILSLTLCVCVYVKECVCMKKKA